MAIQNPCSFLGLKGTTLPIKILLILPKPSQTHLPLWNRFSSLWPNRGAPPPQHCSTWIGLPLCYKIFCLFTRFRYLAQPFQSQTDDRIWWLPYCSWHAVCHLPPRFPFERSRHLLHGYYMLLCSSTVLSQSLSLSLSLFMHPCMGLFRGGIR